MRISSQEYWSGFPFLSAGYLPHPGIEPLSPALADGLFTWEAHHDGLRSTIQTEPTGVWQVMEVGRQVAAM